jgi:2-oxoglutarate ferredoxin oxidoreductase subunit gamma
MGTTEIRIGGLGGQGVILSGMILGKAASIYDGRHATLIQAFGPEARGSACSAQVTLSDDPIGYPYVRKPDVLVVMSRDAHTLFRPDLREGGILLYEQDLVDPGEVAGVRAYGIHATRMAEELGRRLVLNIVMVGFFTGVTDFVTLESAEKAVMDSVPRGTENLNLKAFRMGYDHGRERLAAG